MDWDGKNDNLLEWPVKKYLDATGAGKDVPGSGSAAALVGLVGAQLAKTVITITNREENQRRYAQSLPRLLDIAHDIETRILPSLEGLFQQDSEEFHKLTKLRTRLKGERDAIVVVQLEQQVQEALKTVVNIPMQIANFCLELAEFVRHIFNSGFQSARGDSSIALNVTMGVASGCLPIIYLNLKSCDKSAWKQTVRKRINTIAFKLKQLSKIPSEQCIVLEKEVDDIDAYNQAYNDAINNIRSSFWANSSITDQNIENLAKQIQNTLWVFRKKIWKRNTPQNPIDVLDPAAVLGNILNYKIIYAESLGTNEVNGDMFKIAGIIDKRNKTVELSEQFSIQTMSFTAAHELGHALLHNKITLHRDRPIDGSVQVPWDIQEYQANKFAAFFLMPRKLLESMFKNLFSTERLIINESTVFELTGTTKVSDFKKSCVDLLGFASIIAGVESFEGRQFQSLADVFGVSVKTMAIQLKDMGLVEF